MAQDGNPLPGTRCLARDADPKRQRRILALDGGGIRGIISVEVLRRLEALLREGTGRPNLRLCEWFDLIAGTSTGAITAALLVTGHTAEDVSRFYDDEAHALFKPATLTNRLRHRYDSAHLGRRLREVFGAETTLGSTSLRSLVLLVLRNATTDSPWFLTNNPAARFNDRRLPGCNLDLPLWQLVRASAAAPTYFQPETIQVGKETFVFSDGGLTSYNNPAFKAFLVATLEPYQLSWPTGPERLLVVSVGTGTPTLANPGLAPQSMHLLYHAQTLPRALLNSAAFQQDLLCRVFGDCLVGELLDLEVGDLIRTHGPAEPRLFTYLRYDVPLTTSGLESIGCGQFDAVRLSRLDDVTGVPQLRQVGAALAEARVRAHDFAAFLPVRPTSSQAL